MGVDSVQGPGGPYGVSGDSSSSNESDFWNAILAQLQQAMKDPASDCPSQDAAARMLEGMLDALSAFMNDPNLQGTQLQKEFLALQADVKQYVQGTATWMQIWGAGGDLQTFVNDLTSQASQLTLKDPNGDMITALTELGNAVGSNMGSGGIYDLRNAQFGESASAYFGGETDMFTALCTDAPASPFAMNAPARDAILNATQNFLRDVENDPMPNTGWNQTNMYNFLNGAGPARNQMGLTGAIQLLEGTPPSDWSAWQPASGPPTTQVWQAIVFLLEKYWTELSPTDLQSPSQLLNNVAFRNLEGMLDGLKAFISDANMPQNIKDLYNKLMVSNPNNPEGGLSDLDRLISQSSSDFATCLKTFQNDASSLLQAFQQLPSNFQLATPNEDLAQTLRNIGDWFAQHTDPNAKDPRFLYVNGSYGLSANPYFAGLESVIGVFTTFPVNNPFAQNEDFLKQVDWAIRRELQTAVDNPDTENITSLLTGPFGLAAVIQELGNIDPDLDPTVYINPSWYNPPYH